MVGMEEDQQSASLANPYHTPESSPVPERVRTYITPASFRLLLGLSLVLVVLQISVDFMTEHTLPPALREYASRDEGVPEGIQAIAVGGVGLLAFLILVASYVGMFMLRKWGRLCYVLSNTVGIAAITLLPPLVTSSYEAALDDLLSVVIGMIIAIAYFTPLFDHAEEERLKLRGSL
jgi:hypothetical protein